MRKFFAVLLLCSLPGALLSQTTSNIGLPTQSTGANAGTWGTVLNSGLTTIDLIHGPTCFPALKAGADLAAQINACYLDSRTTSVRAGIIDATVGYAIGSTQATNSNPFAGANKSGRLMLGCYTIVASVTWLTPQKKFTTEGCSPGGTSPLGTGGQTTAGENTIFQPCDGAGSPAAACSGSILSANNLLFVSENSATITAGGCTEVGTLATCVTSAPHDFCNALASGGFAGQRVVVSGNSVGGYNGTFTIGTCPTTSSFTFTTVGALGVGNGGTATHPLRQHGPFSASGSGLTGPGNYAAIIALGAQSNNGTCGTGPIGANWMNNAFGGQINNVAFDMNGLNGVIGIYSGNEQERGGIHNVSTMNYGGKLVGVDGAGFMWDRNSYNTADACSAALTNGGPSHFEIEHYYADAAPAIANTPNFQGYCGILAGNNNTAATDGGNSSPKGLAQFGLHYGTCRGLNNGGAGKTRYGFWIENYDDGVVELFHFENIANDPIYLHGTNGQTAQGWAMLYNDFASSSGSGNGVVHFDVGTDNNIVLMARGASGATPAGVRDEVYGCAGAFGAAPPCIVNGTVGGNPVIIYAQGGLQLPNCLQLSNSTTPVSLCAGTGAPTSGCGTTFPTGSLWMRLDATGTNTTEWACKGSGTWTAVN